ncbi:MAG: phosphoglycerate kinase [Candidatus Sungbacteria bacterium]|nr:phosphoglycerate kinase [Candidatus Sungbacteria bacterium]
MTLTNGEIADSSRIEGVVPTLRALDRAGARVRIIAHLGRPHGAYDPALSLAPMGRALAKLLDRRVLLVQNPFAAEALAKYKTASDILLFENVRFWPGEEKNSRAFAMGLARWGNLYVNEAFANCHRAHASMSALPAMLPAYAGLHLESEIKALAHLAANPKRPFVAVLGGAKIETKLPLIRRFVRDADEVLIGGALANTLFALRGFGVGKSTAEPQSRVPYTLLHSKKLYLPSDVLAADGLEAGAQCRVTAPDDVKDDEYIVDMGPETCASFAERIARARTVVWNGPMGLAEIEEFSRGTLAIAGAMKNNKGFTVAGGGDTLAALVRHRTDKQFSHLSMGGGAMLAFLAGEKLPGLEALRQ